MEPQKTEKYFIVRSFIDRKGNKYRARKEPYLYGELPKDKRDNINFCVKASEGTVSVKTFNANKEEPITNFSDKPIKIETQQLEFDIKEKPLQKNEPVKEDVKIDKKAEEKETDSSNSIDKKTSTISTKKKGK